MLADGGYGDWKYSRTNLVAKMDHLKRLVPMIMERHHLDGVVLHGSSGVWLGAALVLEKVLPSHAGLFLVRKPGEQSHGNIVEGDGDTEATKLLMLDDFVSSGETIRRVQQLIVDNKPRPAYVFAVLEHDRIFSSKDYTKHSYTMQHSEGEFLVY